VRYASRILGDRAQAEDVVQEAYIRLSAAEADGRSDYSVVQPVAYLYRIVRNLALDWVRRSSIDAAASRVLNQLHIVDAQAPSAETVLLRRDELRLLASAMDELPQRTRVAFNMYRVEGFTLQQVAHRLGISVTRAHQLVQEAIVHGTTRLGDLGY
jgi:RNA polymerase sigma-70 factor (ECF subfamily)